MHLNGKVAAALMEKVKAGKEKASNSGFGGKGLEKLDQERDAAKARERKTYKTGEEGDEEEREEKDTTGDDLVAKAASGVKAFDATPAQVPGVPKGIDLVTAANGRAFCARGKPRRIVQTGCDGSSRRHVSCRRESGRLSCQWRRLERYG